MYVVIFEAKIHEEYLETYLEHAKEMREEVEKINGFLSVERFKSLYEEGKYLSMSLWESAEAIHQWKQNSRHQIEQEMGKSKYFTGYRIRVAKIEREYGNFPSV